MTFPKLSGFIHFSKTFPGLENAVLKFHDFSRFFMTVRTLNNETRIYESFTFRNKLQKKLLFHDIQFFCDVPVCMYVLVLSKLKR